MVYASQDGHTGLSASQARETLDRDGPNELPRKNKRTPLRIASEVLREPMRAMLLGAGPIYLLLGDKTEAVIFLLFAGFSVTVTMVQEARTENVLEALRDLSAPRACHSGWRDDPHSGPAKSWKAASLSWTRAIVCRPKPSCSRHESYRRTSRG